MRVGISPILLLCFFLSRMVLADFLIQHPLEIKGHRYLLVIVLPNYYGNFFGSWDQLDFELANLEANPADPKLVQAWQMALQDRQWKAYQRAPWLEGKSIYDVKFQDFRSSERFDDGRSALFSILKVPHTFSPAEPVWPSETMELRGLVRLSSTLFATREDPPERQNQAYLPWQLRAIRSPEAYLQNIADPISGEVSVEKQLARLVPIFKAAENPVASLPTSFYWPEGGLLELKAWFHVPEVLRDVDANGHTERMVVDFLPDLFQIVNMYGGFERTGWTWSDLERGTGAKLGESEMIKMEALFGRPLTADKLGIRAGHYFSDVLDPVLAQREITEFKLGLRRQYPDPDFPAAAHILSGKKSVVLPAMSEWMAKRSGHGLIPFSRIVMEKRSLPCAETLRQLGGPPFQPLRDVRGLAVSFVPAGVNLPKLKFVEIGDFGP